MKGLEGTKGPGMWVCCVSDNRYSFDNEKSKQCYYQGTREFNILNLWKVSSLYYMSVS